MATALYIPRTPEQDQEEIENGWMHSWMHEWFPPQVQIQIWEMNQGVGEK